MSQADIMALVRAINESEERARLERAQADAFRRRLTSALMWKDGGFPQKPEGFDELVASLNSDARRVIGEVLAATHAFAYPRAA